MKTKLMTLQDATGFFRDGMTIMVGGFMGIGTPSRLVEALLESGVRDLTLIANDTAFVDTGIGPLIVNGRVRKVIASHIGTNPETGRRMISGEMDVVLVPQRYANRANSLWWSWTWWFSHPNWCRHRRRGRQTDTDTRR